HRLQVEVEGTDLGFGALPPIAIRRRALRPERVRVPERAGASFTMPSWALPAAASSGRLPLPLNPLGRLAGARRKHLAQRIEGRVKLFIGHRLDAPQPSCPEAQARRRSSRRLPVARGAISQRPYSPPNPSQSIDATLLPPAHKETAVACVRIVEDGELSRCRQNPFRGLAISA